MRKYYLTTISTPKKNTITKIILTVLLLGSFLFNSKGYAQDADGDGILDNDECAPTTNAAWTEAGGINVYTIGGLTDGSGSVVSNWDGDVVSNGGTVTSIADWTGSTPFSGPGYTISHSIDVVNPVSVVSTGSPVWQSGSGGTGMVIESPDPDFAPSPFIITTTIIFTTPVNAAGFDMVDLFDYTGTYATNVEIEVDGNKVWETPSSNGVGNGLTGLLDYNDGQGNLQGQMLFGQNIENFVGIISSVEISAITIRFIAGPVIAAPAGREFHAFDNLRFATFAFCDDDSDGVANISDLDSDNDGIPDSLEGNGDLDGDLTPNFLDIDSDGDGVFDVNEAGHGQLDADNDGDIDAANSITVGANGLLDVLETPDDSGVLNYSVLDTDGDASINALDVDDDGDGVDTANENADPNNDGDPTDAQNTDGDAIPDYLDTDDDGDGVDTVNENPNPDGDGDPSTGATQDSDGDGTDDYLDTDDDGDGVDTVNENPNPDGDGDPSTGATQDSDGDGTDDYLDTDDDGDGVDTVNENPNPDGDGDPSTGATQDSDGDGTDDYLDTDDDGDGVDTANENPNPDGDGDPSTGATQDSDGDGTDDYLDTDDDGDGVDTANENPNPDGDGDPSTGATQDSDGDGTDDYLDTDDDGDGVDTVNENPNPDGDGDPSTGATQDSDGDGTDDYLDTDDDGDGVDTVNENPDPDGDGDPSTGATQDSDGDGTDDYLDIDDDGDGINTQIESDNTDGDGDPNTGIVINTDSDFLLNYLDFDSDNDGITDLIEGITNTDGDALPNYLDLDSDGDGLPDNIEAQVTIGYISPTGTVDPLTGIDTAYGVGLTPVNTDFATSGDAFPDYIDLDSDDEGANDTSEAGLTLSGVVGANGLDSNSETVDDYSDVNGIFDDPTTLPDTDGDLNFGGDVDYRDAINNVDTDLDGVVDTADLDDDNDGVLDIDETLGGLDPSADVDMDGVPFYLDDDDGNASIGNDDGLIQPGFDTDGDLIPNHFDLDSDEDGINDILEAGGTDTDNDGLVDGFIDVAPVDGLTDSGAWLKVDTDLDGIQNILDLDSDNDGILDIEEAITDSDGDLIANYLDLDTDNDGILDIVEDGHAALDTDNDGRTNGVVGLNGLDDSLETAVDSGILITPVQDSDLDTIPDFRDIDSDTDGIPDIIEGQTTAGFIDPNGAYDVNGVDTAYSPAGISPINTDVAATNGDLVPDYLDLDSDADGLPDVLEGWDFDNDFIAETLPNSIDIDLDGLDDAFDADTAGFDPTNGINAPIDALDFPDVDNVGGDLDWREALDTDGDGVIDIADLDDDNDGIIDLDENTDPWVDGDGDGWPVFLDDNDGDNAIFDTNGVEAAFDADADGVPNHLDLDSDNDGIADVIEAGLLDIDGDGIVDGFIDVGPINGVHDPIDSTPFTAPDRDGDGVTNNFDLDSDNDGITDTTEIGFVDADGNGSLDGFTDANNNGYDDTLEGVVLVPVNTDFTYTGDALPDIFDLDSDADGISDVIEAGGIDANGDAHIDYVNLDDPITMVDVNNNGLADAIDPNIGGTPLSVPNSDTDMVADYRDIDSDADGIIDNIEAQTTAGYNAPVGGDIDSDGLDDSYDADNENAVGGGGGAVSTPIIPVNTDLTDTPDYLDTDSDNDGDLDILEGWDTNNDGVITPPGEFEPAPGDNDNDGLDNGFDVDNFNLDPTNGGQIPTDFPNLDPTPLDTDQDWREALDIDNDNDGINDPIDLDDDNDGIPDTDEGGDFLDTDGDGVPNRYDLDSDNDGIYDVVESGQLNGTTAIDIGNDGILDGAPVDFGANGLLDFIETAVDSGILITPTADSTADNVTGLPAPDGIFDAYELDADNDACFDLVEAGFGAEDGDDNGILGNDVGLTVDPTNGLVNTAGLTLGYTNPNDIDVNSILDFQEFSVTTTITSQPTNPAPILAGANVSISVVSTGDTFVWEESTDGGANWTPIVDGGASPVYAGAMTDNLTLTNVPASYAGYLYRVQLGTSNYACDTPVTSNAVSITILGDADGDTIADGIDLDDDNDGIPDLIEDASGNLDIDGDGVPNRFDLDSDNDGIYDVVESGQLNGATIIDADNDGRLDGADAAGVGANGLFNLIETDDSPTATVSTLTADSDGDGIPDSNEINADNDGCNDVEEAGFTDLDGSGRLGSDTGLMVDGVGLVTTGSDGYTEPLDNDFNGIYDFQEVGAQVTLTNQPLDDTITINMNANFDVTAVSPVFQWQESIDGGVNWSDISNGGSNPTYSGANSDALTLTFVPGSFNGYQYRVVLTAPAFACNSTIISNSAVLTVYADFDGDGIGDPVDLDDDNDGLSDLIESGGVDPTADVDGDGVPAYLDDNDNNISVGDTDGVETAFDFDGDGLANHLELDADNDGIYDTNEAGFGDLDANNDGVVDGVPADFGANGLFNTLEDNDSSTAINNYTPLNTDGDLTPNFIDIDDDGDDVRTIYEDADANGDGDPSDFLDTDLDSIPNYLDEDDDGDNVNTIYEVNDADADGNPGTNPIDTDNDTTLDYLDVDDDGDTVNTIYEVDNTDLDGNPNSGVIINTDNADTLDYLDIDDDNDSVYTIYEVDNSDADNNPNTNPLDTDGDLIWNHQDIDDDGDEVNTIYENPVASGDNGNPVNAQNTDADAVPDYLDVDDDGDTVWTIFEGPNPDGDQNPNTGNTLDTDGDGEFDYLDVDDDGDTVATIDENPDFNGDGNPDDAQDTDGDVIFDYLDIDDDNDGILTAVEESSPDGDNDSNPNYLDLDSDDDGIPDNVEAQTTAGYIAPSGDDNNNGLDDSYESTNGLDPINFDGTDDPDYLDDDSDNDNVPDFVEGHDFNADGEPDVEATGNDTDGDGLDDAYDSSGDYSDPNGNVVTNSPETELPNRDQSLFDMFSPTTAITPDAQVDYRDTDDDGDGRLTNSTGEDGEDTDSDGNPRNDNCNGPPDNNSPNYLDPVPCNFIPSGFSPNGDNQNEVFIINQLSQYPNFTMDVYDRWGNIVYEYSNDGRSEPIWWDGFSSGSRTLNKGQKVPVGTYYYVIEYNQDGRKPIAGWVYINY